MKIEKEHFPVLKKDISFYYGREDDGSPNFCGRPIEDNNLLFRDMVKDIITSKKTSLIFLSKTFQESCAKVKGRLSTLIKDIPDCQMIVCMYRGGSPQSIIIKKQGFGLDVIELDDHRGCIWNHIKHDVRNEIKHKIFEDAFGIAEELYFDEGTMSLSYEETSPEEEDIIDRESSVDSESIAVSAALLYFFAEVERLELSVIKRKGKLNNCNYKSNADQSITVLDSTWFTTLVQSAGFKVRGHFRLQPYGEGLKQKKLIWISDFDKQGYTREAKILNTDK